MTKSLNISQKKTFDVMGVAGLILMPKNQLRFFSLSVRLPIVNLMREMKSLVMEKRHYENRDESSSILTFWKIWTIKILMQRLISMVFQPNSPLKEYDLPFEILIDELKHFVSEQIQFE